MNAKKNGPTIIKHVEDTEAGYLMKYTLFEEKADQKKLYDMIGEKAKKHRNIYSVKIETVSVINPSDITVTSLPDMSVDKEESKRLIDFLCENKVSADSAYDAIDEINCFLLSERKKRCESVVRRQERAGKKSAIEERREPAQDNNSLRKERTGLIKEAQPKFCKGKRTFRTAAVAGAI